MKGLDIAREFYNQFGKSMLENNFPTVKDRIAVGLIGEGSECFGYDDDISRDHDFEAGFCLFVTREDEQKFGFELERAYSKLPKEFMGLKRKILSPVGGDRHGVICIDDFYSKFLGCNCCPKSYKQWLYLPSHSLASACNGEVFADNLGEFSKIRNILLKGYPEDVRRKKISAYSALMAQSGQHNYKRCAVRGETGAAQLAIYEFVKSTISVIYLLNNKFEPFYKWVYRGMRDLPILGDLEFTLSGLTEMDNSRTRIKEKLEIVEDISGIIIKEFKNQNITKASCDDLEQHALSIQDGITDVELRNMHLMEGV